MRKLIISLKSSTEVLNDFKDAFKKVRDKKIKSQHFELSFDNRKDFNKFIRNLDILSIIINFNPASIYELAKILDKDLSNLLKILKFYEVYGVLTLKKKVNGERSKSVPKVNFQKIEFDLVA